MISAAMALALFQAAAPSPAPAPLGQDASPPIRRQTFSVRVPGISYPEALLPMVRQYLNCTQPPLGTFDSELGHGGMLRARLEGCRAVRDQAVASAIAAYPKGRPGDPRAHVAAIFESLDRGAVLNARFMDRMEAGEVSPPAEGQTIILQDEDDGSDDR